MEEITKKRLLRRLEALPDDQVYQVLDFIEFLETKYARETARKPDPFQQFAERVEDGMRARSLAPKAMRGTMKIMGTAGKVLDGMRDLVTPPTRPTGSTGSKGSTGSGDEGRSGTSGGSGGAGTSGGAGGRGRSGTSGGSGSAGGGADSGAA